MKKNKLLPLYLSFFTLALLLCSCSKSQQNSTDQNSASSIATVANATTTTTFSTLVWSDEFDGTAVNTANWGYDLGGGGWGNNEKEYYQAANATVSNGNLVITAKKQRVKSNAYTSARLKTQGKKEFTYGRIEARIKIPVGKGLWPAFWMLGANINTVSWPACGETDIMEHINTDNTFYGTMHWDYNGHKSAGGNTTISNPGEYHIYSIEWDATIIRWYVDGVQYFENSTSNGVNGTTAFQKPFFILLNLAVGGNWPGQTIDETKLPASMYVDYVRVYQ